MALRLASSGQHKLTMSEVKAHGLQGHGRASSHKPELILNNFNTRLGQRVGRMFASLFNQDPNFKGRRAVTFHNQRDYIFFRWEFVSCAELNTCCHA